MTYSPGGDRLTLGGVLTIRKFGGVDGKILMFGGIYVLWYQAQDFSKYLRPQGRT